MKKKMALLVDLTADERAGIEKIAPQYSIIQTIEEQDLATAEIIFGWTEHLKDVIHQGESHIQWIQYPYAGVDHLPLTAMQQQDIQLTSGSGTNAHAVAESTFALILGITRNIVEASHHQEKSDWFSPEHRYELKDKTMLIVGAGNIGERIGALGQAFLMKTIGINRSGSKIQHMDEQYLQTDLADIIHKADIVVNVLPATEETHYLFNQELFERMKETAIFVNVGRGETVATDDLLTALDEETIAWAALDVFEEEPLPAKHPLWTHEKVLITPHIAGQVERQLDYAYPIFMKNLEAYLADQDFPCNKVEFDKGY